MASPTPARAKALAGSPTARAGAPGAAERLSLARDSRDEEPAMSGRTPKLLARAARTVAPIPNREETDGPPTPRWVASEMTLTMEPVPVAGVKAMEPLASRLKAP